MSNQKRQHLTVIGGGIQTEDDIDSWMEGSDAAGLDPAQERTARLYLHDQCSLIEAEDYGAIQRHAEALARRGMPQDWINRELRQSCVYWYGFKESPHQQNKFHEAVRRGVNIFERFKDVLVTSSDNGQTLAERYRAKDWDYFKALPDVNYFWQGILAEKTFFVLYGKEKSGKTYFALSLALAMATSYRSDQDFCDLRIKWGRVLYIIAEGSESEYRNRLEAWMRAELKRRLGPKTSAETRAKLRHELEELVRNNFKTVTVSVPINQPEHVRALLDGNAGDGDRDARKWDLVVIDTYFRNTTGDVNDQKDSAAFVAGVDTIREETGAAVMVLHHLGKNEKRGAFGSVNLTAACDGAAKIIRIGDERVFSIDMLRNGDDSQDDIVYRLAPDLLGITDDGEQRSCHVEFIERRRKGQTKSGDTSREDEENQVLKLLATKRPKSQGELADLAGLSRNQVRTRLKSLRQSGYVEESGLALTTKGRTVADDIEDQDEGDDWG